VGGDAAWAYFFGEKSAPSFVQAPPVARETALTRMDVEEHHEGDGLYRQGDRLCAVNLAKKRLRIDRASLDRYLDVAPS